MHILELINGERTKLQGYSLKEMLRRAGAEDANLIAPDGELLHCASWF